ncbi:MAG: glutamate--tRNA ligase [Candidatus Aenigmarchaeota archaeon]|nr:glutamate--tRNA ligase [Candidatus Aenigmarchaeota archaeon]
MKKTILKHVLINAIEYNGKANPKSVLGKVIAEDPSLKKDMKRLVQEVNKIVEQVNSWSLEKQKKELEKFGKIEKKEKKQRRGLPDLPNVKGKVVMRLAPYPSGPLHIGNAKQFIINDWYVKKYKGKLILFIDDTIGSERKQIVKEAYDLIPEGLKWLGIKFDKKIYYKSDRLEIYYKYGEDIIKKGKAYACECDQKTLRENRKKGIECKCRQRSVQENLDKWKEMLNGKYKEGEISIRIKTSMQDPDPAFRDRVLFRISERSHPRVGKKYKVWPLLDFSWAIDDHLLGVTHILRGKELMIESKMEKYIWDIFGWKHPEIIHTGSLIIEGIKLSKSKAQQEVMSGQYSGWDDPRTWSLQSLAKRGFEPEAIRQFILSFGVTEHESHVPIDKLYTINRKLIDNKAKRYFFVSNPIEIQLDKIPIKEAKAPLFPGKRKYRKIPVSKKIFIEKQDFVANRGKEVRLMHLFNIKIDKKAKYTSKNLKDIPKIHWVSKDAVKIKVVLENGKIIEGIGEPELKKVEPNNLVQMERLFFARCDSKLKFYYLHR